MSEVRLWAIRLALEECWSDMLTYKNQGTEAFRKKSKIGRLTGATPYMGINPSAELDSVFVLYKSPEEAEKAFHVAEKIFDTVQIVANPAYVDRKYLQKH